MHPATPIRNGRRFPRSSTPRRPGRRARTNRGERGSTSSLELMALTPMLALGVLFILWAGRSARAELVTSLAAQEAAVAAALCCNDSTPDSPADGNHPNERTDAESHREHMAQAVLDARPGLDYLCLDGPQPPPDRFGLVAETTADLSPGEAADSTAQRLLIVTTHVTCRTDGATAPIRGLFGTRTHHGHGAHVAVLAQPTKPDSETPDESESDTP